jgi:hypothetical protein
MLNYSYRAAESPKDCDRVVGHCAHDLVDDFVAREEGAATLARLHEAALADEEGRRFRANWRRHRTVASLVT